MVARSSLSVYQRKRDFEHTTEPRGAVGRAGHLRSFVVQKHAARSLHYDFRLAIDGTLKSWAMPKGPSLDPSVKRMAVQVKDHPLAYADFEGTIPPKHYGAGNVIVWDRGTWSPVGNARRGLRDGHLKFDLNGTKLRGRWALVRMKSRADERQTNWLLMKERDAEARDAESFDVLVAEPDSVVGPAPASPPASPPASLRSSPRSALPAFLAPQLATLVSAIPTGDDWIYEIKFDGYRLLTRVEGASVRCFTRSGSDWSSKLRTLVDVIRALKLAPCWLDGEVVVLNVDGVPDFQALQNAFDAKSTQALTYFVFDLPFFDGSDLRSQPLAARRERLRKVLAANPQTSLRFSEAFTGSAAVLLVSARKAGLEGLIGKRRDSMYRSGARSTEWVKLKVMQRQEFVIGGYTDPKGARTGIGALLLGTHDAKGVLRYAGNVGIGFDQRALEALKNRLGPLSAAQSPFGDAPGTVGSRGAVKPHWVAPSLLAEVSFAQWTSTGRLRQAVFHGLRDDKPARQVEKEKPMRASALAPSRKPPSGEPHLSHPERVIDPASGVTKGELVEFYTRIAPLMLPHLKARPIALLRAPEGVDGPQFFQKHADENTLLGIESQIESLDPGHGPLLVVTAARGLQSAAQMNVIELHTWNTTTRAPTHPDRMVFDLDPGEGVAWPAVCEAARLMHAFLAELGLTSLVKTSGGKGLHLIVPLAAKHEWQLVRQFSRAIVVHLSQVVPERFVSKSGPRNRIGKIFVDYLRNGWGATTASAWSPRARPGIGVSVPVEWSELEQIESGAHWSVRDIDRLMTRGNSPWGMLGTSRQTLGKAMRKLKFDAEHLR